MSDAEFNSPEFIQDPHPFYKRWREAEKPIWKTERFGGWVVSRYDDVKRTISDHRTFRQSKSWDQALIETLKPIGLPMMAMDNPQHAELRRAIADLYSPKAIKVRMTPVAEKLANELIGKLKGKDRCELNMEFLDPFIARFLTSYLGTEDTDELYKLYLSLAEAHVRSREKGGISISQEAVDAAEKMGQYFWRLAEKRLTDPQDDLITQLLKKDIPRSDAIQVSASTMLAGVETTMRGMANTIVGLLQFPDQLAMLKQDPELSAQAFEEGQRWIAVVQIKRREVNKETEFYGQVLKEGDQVVALMGSATRDPAKYENPDAFQIKRDTTEHIGFGAGIHYCVGAPLSRVMATVAIPMLFDRFPRLRLDDSTKLEWVGPIRRGPKNLNVLLS